MRRHPRQPAQLVGAQAQDVVEAGIGALELQRVVELTLAAEHAGRQLVCEPAVALRKAGEIAIARVGQGSAGSYCAENLECRVPCVPNPAYPWSEMTALPLRGAACDRRETRHGPRSSPAAWHAPSIRDPELRRWRCSSRCRRRLAPS